MIWARVYTRKNGVTMVKLRIVGYYKTKDTTTQDHQSFQNIPAHIGDQWYGITMKGSKGELLVTDTLVQL